MIIRHIFSSQCNWATCVSEKNYSDEYLMCMSETIKTQTPLTSLHGGMTNWSKELLQLHILYLEQYNADTTIYSTGNVSQWSRQIWKRTIVALSRVFMSMIQTTIQTNHLSTTPAMIRGTQMIFLTPASLQNISHGEILYVTIYISHALEMNVYKCHENNKIILNNHYRCVIFFRRRFDNSKPWSEEKFIVPWSFLLWTLSVCRRCSSEGNVLFC